MFRTLLASFAIILSASTTADAQRYYRPPRPSFGGIFPGSQYPGSYPQWPVPIPGPQPQFPVPIPHGSAFDGQWYFRGDPTKPAYIQSVATQRGQQVILTNEKGSPAMGWVSRDGNRVVVPEWDIVGTLREGGRALVWPNGDFWAR
jgi:hypothetical protein